MKQTHSLLTKEEYNSIKSGDKLERMLAFCIPMIVIVQHVKDDVIYTAGGWTFDANTGLEIDEDIAATVSYISNILTD
jgi:hypothetical protein